MQISLVCIGKTDNTELKKLINYYIKRLPKFINFSLIELPDVKNTKNITDIQLKKEEAKLFSKYINIGDILVLLDEKAEQFSSMEFAMQIKNHMNISTKHLVFLVGGAYGFSEEIYKIAKQKISLSKMTFTHQMIRLFFVEQLYRAISILQNKPYHNN